MGDVGDDHGSEFRLTERMRAQLDAMADQYFRSLGYRPPPHSIDLAQATALLEVPDAAEQAVPAASPLEVARVRETGRTLVEDIAAVAPRELEFDPFLGETAAESLENNLGGIRAVLRGEVFVAAVAAECERVRAQVLAMKPDFDAVGATLQARDRQRAELEAQARENFHHAQSRLSELDDGAGQDPPAGAEALRVRYGLDATTAANIVEFLDMGRQLDGFNDSVAAFGDFWGGVLDVARVSYTAATAKRRRRRRIRRAVSRLGIVAVVAACALFLDQFVGSFGAFALSAAIAGLVFLADLRIDRWLDDRARMSQMGDLVEAIERSETVLVELLQRETQANGLRALRGLPRVRLVRRAVLSPPQV